MKLELGGLPWTCLQGEPTGLNWCNAADASNVYKDPPTAWLSTHGRGDACSLLDWVDEPLHCWCSSCGLDLLSPLNAVPSRDWEVSHAQALHWDDPVGCNTAVVAHRRVCRPQQLTTDAFVRMHHVTSPAVNTAPDCIASSCRCITGNFSFCTCQ